MPSRFIAQGPQPLHPSESVSERSNQLVPFTLGAAGITTAGFLPYGQGRLWDTYLAGIRAAETGFPGAILRTFRVSEFLSPLETWDKVGISATDMRTGGKYSDLLRQTFSPDLRDATLKRTGSIFGEVSTAGRGIGVGLQIEGGTQRGASIADYYARLKGIPLTFDESIGEAALRSRWKAEDLNIPFKDWLDEIERVQGPQRPRLILGAAYRDNISLLGKEINLTRKSQKLVAKAEVLANLLRAKTATSTGRLAMLMEKGLDLPLVSKITEKVPIFEHLRIKPGSSTSMVGQFIKKGLGVAAIWKGLEYYDYLRSEGSVWGTALGTAGGAGIGGFLFKKAGAKVSIPGLAIGAAAGLYTALSPRFEHGFFHGAATYGADINLARSELSEATGLTESLQSQEEISPDLISLKTALGFAGVSALGVGTFSYGKYLLEGSAKRINKETGKSFAVILDDLRKAKKVALKDVGVWGTALGEKVAATRVGGKIADSKLGKILSKIEKPWQMGAIAGLAAWAGLSTIVPLISGNIGAAIPGLNLFGTTETPEELESIYSGEELVPVYKGRWWEMGRSSPYEGSRIDYYRPHMLHRLKTRAYQKGLYGDESERWDYDPVLHPLNALFGSDEWKYHYELKHQQDRPAPMTGTYGEDVPFIGPLIAATFGKLFKPRKLIRPEEWSLGGGEYVHRPDRKELEPAPELGGLGPGAPVSPDESSQLFNQLMYRRREGIGLVGFAEGALQKTITGREEFFQNLRTIDTMGKETGAEYWLWKHLNLGGAIGMSETVRRFIPRTPSYLETYNPLRNALPSWMPENYFLDLKYGNPFSKIPEAELRLPGSGYSAIHPELEGVSPEDYPLAHRVKILGDVAMWSPEYRQALSTAKSRMNEMSTKEANLVYETEEQVKQRKIRREFQEYRFDENQLVSQEVTVRDVLNARQVLTKEFGNIPISIQGVGAVQDTQEATNFARNLLEGKTIDVKMPAIQARRFTPSGNLKATAYVGGEEYSGVLAKEGIAKQTELQDEFSVTNLSANQKLAGAISEFALHNIETPLEYLTPLSPASKLIRHRSAIEEYVASEAIGTSASFWDKPVENFLSPAASMTGYKLGISDIPESVQKRRGIEEYFDMLKWFKTSRLEKQSHRSGDEAQAVQYSLKRQKTLFGTDVFGSPMNVLRALPRRDRDFFTAFSQAKSEEDRARIMSLVPDNEKRVYLANWLQNEKIAAVAKRAAGQATKDDEQVMAMASKMRKSEGFSYSQSMENQWMSETDGKYPFDNWLREKKAEEYFQSHSLPGANWLGWNPAVDLDDVKMKFVDQAGLDYHDFNLWGPRERSLARKPYINSELISQMFASANYDDVSKRLMNAKSFGGHTSAHLVHADVPSTYNIDVKDGRKGMIDGALSRLGAR